MLQRHGFAGTGYFLPQVALQQQCTSPSTTIQATKRTLEVNGKAASVMGLLQPNGAQGMSCVVNDPFQVVLENKLTVPTAIHWHGLHPPNNEDGVPGVTQPPIRPGASVFYNFPIQPAGTHWMHSHQGLQEASLLAAPLIVHDTADQALDEQDVVVFLSDFSFTPPEEIYAKLRQGQKAHICRRPKTSSSKHGHEAQAPSPTPMTSTTMLIWRTTAP